MCQLPECVCLLDVRHSQSETINFYTKSPFCDQPTTKSWRELTVVERQNLTRKWMTFRVDFELFWTVRPLYTKTGCQLATKLKSVVAKCEFLIALATPWWQLSTLALPQKSFASIWCSARWHCLGFPLQYKLFLYSVDGRCLSSYQPYEFALGIKTVTWSPSSQFLAIGSFDQKVQYPVYEL